MAQEQKTKSKKKVEETVEVEAKDVKDPGLDADIDDLLADIDGVLEENAQEFVEGFIQKGGQ